MTPEGAPYILMEFLEGVSLQQRLADQGRLALPQALEIARQAGSALAAAHAAGIVHRDLKPENLFLVPEAGAPGGERVKILDFGIAKIRRSGGSDGTLRTQTGLIMGSPSYMSPEQCKDSADVDLRSDIYSFATIVYKMLAGRTPYVAGSATEMLVMHLSATPPPLREWVPDVPDHVEAAVERGLARSREDRFDSMASFIGALRGEARGGAAALGQLSPSAEVPAVGEDPMSGSGRTPVAQPARTVSLPTGEGGAAGSGDAPLAATRRLPAAGGSRGSGADRTGAARPITTFSRATGEVGVAVSDDGLLAAARPRRWPFFAFGAMAVAGLARFLLVRPSHDSAPRPTRSTVVATAAGVAGPVVAAPPDAGPVAVLPSRADGGAAPPAVAGARSDTKPARAAAVAASAAPLGRRHANVQTPRSASQRPAAARGGSPSNPLPPAPPKQDNPAGF